MTQFTCKGVKQINNRISLNMTFIFTIRISQRFSSAREFQMGNFQKYWSHNVGQDFIVLDFFHGRKILKVDGRDGRDPQNWEKNASTGRFTCMDHQYQQNKQQPLTSNHQIHMSLIYDIWKWTLRNMLKSLVGTSDCIVKLRIATNRFSVI
jgi:hypothetical protein